MTMRKSLFLLSALVWGIASVQGACENRISEHQPWRVFGPDGKEEKVTSCNRIIQCYPGLCETLGVRDAACCKACRAAGLGNPNCLDRASDCVPVTIIRANSSRIDVGSCQTIKNDYPGFCGPDAFGGRKNACCKSCKGVCVDSATWGIKRKKCRNCNCSFMKQYRKALMRNCCKMNARGVGTRLRCRAACCDTCTDMGYPP